MQILASALPGFRDVRAPAVAGYLWLLFIWLIVRPDLGNRPHDALAGSIYDLGLEVGRPGVFVAVSVAAYLLGALSQEVAPFAWSVYSRLFARRWRKQEKVTMRNAAGEVEMEVPPDHVGFTRPRGSSALRADRERCMNAVSDAASALGPAKHMVYTGFAMDLHQQAQSALDEELRLPAMLLVGDQPQLFAEVDRLKSEGDLRLAAVVPLTAIAALLATHSPVWLLSAPVLAMLAVQGASREEQSRKVIDDSIAHGAIGSSAVANYRAAIDEFEGHLREAASAAA